MRLSWVVVLVLVVLPTGSRAICGDGRLDSGVNSTDTCVDAGQDTTAEQCDIKHSASFGRSGGACDDNCQLDPDAEFYLEEPNNVDESKEWGFTTFAMQNKNEIVYDSDRNMTVVYDHLAPCLYTPLGDEKGYNCTLVTLEDASEEYALLRNCYNTNISSDEFGHRKEDNDDSMEADGHKCPYPVTIRTKPAGGDQLWDIESTSVTHDYDVCFTLTDPQWPYVDAATNQFVPSSTRISYKVTCDPAIQNESFEDCDDATVACTRLGGVSNPCAHMGRKDTDFFQLVVCEGEECTPLDVTDNDVKAYDFAVDSLPSENKLNCSVMLLNNSMLEAYGIRNGDFPLFKDYIG